MPGSLGRPSSRWLTRGEILQAVCQDTQRLSERGDTVLQGEQTFVQGSRRFLATLAGMRVHEIPFPWITSAASYEAGCVFLFFQDTTTGRGPGGAERPLPGLRFDDGDPAGEETKEGTFGSFQAREIAV